MGIIFLTFVTNYFSLKTSQTKPFHRFLGCEAYLCFDHHTIKQKTKTGQEAETLQYVEIVPSMILKILKKCFTLISFYST